MSKHSDRLHNISGVDFGYKYPGGLKLHPTDPFHIKLVDKIMERAQESYTHISQRHNTWRAINEKLTAFIPVDEMEKRVKDKDVRKPISIVIPTSYAQLDTLMTYLVTAFFQDPTFRYEGIGPEDTQGAMMLEQLISVQTHKAKMHLNLHTMFRDSLTYGFGVCSPQWITKKQRVVRARDRTFAGLDFTAILGKERSTREEIVYEGNELRNISPYVFLPDPSVSIDNIQKGEYLGWVFKTNRYNLLREETDPSANMFNAKYLQFISDGRSFLFRDEFGQLDLFHHDDDFHGTEGNITRSPMDEVVMIIDLVPSDSEWKLGKGTKPEKWLFTVVGDSVITRAQPLKLNHGMYPLAVAAPDFDGYRLSPTSKMETIFGMQEQVDFLTNSHIANVRKALNDVIIYDPSQINSHDLANPGPGKLIRTRKRAFGQRISDSIMQLNINDITRQNMSDVSVIMDLMQRASGAGDLAQGVMRRGSERRSATEAGSTAQAAVSRLERGARIIGLMGVQDLGVMLASNTQQYMTQETFVKLSGRHEEELRAIFPDTDRIPVNPLDISIATDVVAHDGSTIQSQSVDQWLSFMQIVGSSETLSQQYDMNRVMKYVMKLMGAKNIEEFATSSQQAPPTQRQVVPDEEVDAQEQAGNLVSIDEAIASL